MVVGGFDDLFNALFLEFFREIFYPLLSSDILLLFLRSLNAFAESESVVFLL